MIRDKHVTNAAWMSYDGENKMQRHDADDVQTDTSYYLYDADGKRKMSTEPAVTKYIHGLGGELLAEATSSGAIAKEYGYRNGDLLVTAKIKPLTTDFRWLVKDHLGTPRMVIGISGDLSAVTRHDYLPFGEEIAPTAFGRSTAQGYGNPQSDGVRQQFTGYERDDESGLDFAEARMFGSSLGRFTTTDPIQITPERLTDPQQLNAYVYVRNNPLAYIDPTGLDSEPADFTSFDKLSEKQQQLLMGYWGKDKKQAAAEWNAFTTNKDTKETAASFLANTGALSRMTIYLGQNANGPAAGMNALDAVSKITDLKADRFQVEYDVGAIDKWQSAGGHFSLATGEKGDKILNGTMTWNTGGVAKGGSVHDGFNRQMHTGDIPHIQFQGNVNKATGKLENAKGEIDTDYRTFLQGHLRYNNSRVIMNYDRHVNKFGNPGFAMKEVKVKTN